MVSVLKGIGFTPQRVAAARGAIESILLAGFAASGQALLAVIDADVPLAYRATAVLVAGFLIRWGEGLIDNISPDKHEANKVRPRP